MSQAITISLSVLEACSLYYALTTVINDENARLTRLSARGGDYQVTGEYLTTITAIRENLVASANEKGQSL